jgi:asparagine synthase (glutamine-hydrolysing)
VGSSQVAVSDLFGVRPVYYTQPPEGPRIAGAVRELLRESAGNRELDPQAAATALCGFLDPRRTLFLGIRRLPPANELLLEEGVTSLRRYWQPPGGDARLDSAADPQLHSAGREVLRAAVARSVGNEPVACALSGGIDSAGLLAWVLQATPAALAFTLCDEGPDSPELRRARKVASALGARLEAVEVAEEDLPAHAVDAILACESLIFNGRAVAKYLFYRALSTRGINTILSGVGADEIFMGDPEALEMSTGEPRFVARMRPDFALAESLLRARWQERLARFALPPAPAGEAGLGFAREVLLRTVLPDLTLPPECHSAARFGIDVRLPYLDREVVEFALRLPPRELVQGTVGKVFLRELWRDAIPDEVRLAPKTARLAPPGGAGPGARRGWIELYHHWLSSSRVDSLQIFEPASVRGLLARYLRREAPDGSTLESMDRVLFRLTSLSVLNERLAG